MMLRLVGLIALCGAFMTPVAADDAVDPFVRDLLIISDWFEGEFDNEEQLWFHRRSRAEGDAPVRVHTAHKRVDLPKFGEHVFYVEEYTENNPENLYRQRLVIFSTDQEEAAIRMRQGFFKKPEKFRGAQNNPNTLKKISASDVFFIDECDVFLRRVADQFEGGMKSKACVFGEGDERRYSVHDVIISQSKFWRIDATMLVADDSFFKGTPLDTPTELRRAKIFSCDVYFYGDGGDQQVVEDLRIHSQGGTAQAIRESDSQSFDILLRDKEYPYYASRPDFIYYSIRESGAARSTAYGVADKNTRQFGLNAGKVGVFCHLEGFAFREPIEALEF